ncbi:hypothetical protein [Streptomyces canus]|uniref:hypothetical protein n=1 Tax=Streptomyces canus TaxID=58343 RepID=UPI00344796FC
MAATWLLPEAVGVTRARELLYTGRELLPEEAVAWGLISGIADDVLEHSLKSRSRSRTPRRSPPASRRRDWSSPRTGGGISALGGTGAAPDLGHVRCP